jgi:hypothetical protein
VNKATFARQKQKHPVVRGGRLLAFVAPPDPVALPVPDISGPVVRKRKTKTMQTSGTFPALATPTPKRKPKKGK